MNQPRRYAELDGYRGLAAVMIVILHAYIYGVYGERGPGVETRPFFRDVVHGTIVGLSFFFVLSGFVIWLPFARAALDRTRPVAIGPYLVRRALRLLPLYLVALAITWLLQAPGNWALLIDHLTLGQIRNTVTPSPLLSPSWSLCIEIVFYALLALLGPLAYVACGRLSSRYGRAALLIAGCTALVAIGLADRAYFVWVKPRDLAAYFHPLYWIDQFAVGMTLATIAALRPVWHRQQAVR